jgi:hypothetical protein
MRSLRKAKAWLKQLLADLEKESVSQMKTRTHCCSEPIEPATKKSTEVRT